MIDWEEIWRVHSPYYCDGKFVLELCNGEKVFFHPGPAFGDGSHPTTNLVLENLPEVVKDKVVVDLGSGSGVLSFAASKLGAKEVYSFEIDDPSIETMKTNLLLNKIKNIYINKKPDRFDIVLLNMISSEQMIALKSHPYLLKGNAIFLISGILAEEVDTVLGYLNNPTVLRSYTSGKWAFLSCRPNSSSKK